MKEDKATNCHHYQVPVYLYMRPQNFYTHQLFNTNDQKSKPGPIHLAEVRRIENKREQAATHQTGNRNSHNPSGSEQAYSLPIYSFERAIAQTYTNSSTRDAHRS
jgi:hypothetical protein